MSRSLRIAVADDEQDMRDYFEKILPVLGHQVVAVAENGRQLIDHAARAEVDLVITDIRMPVLDGLEAAEAICRQRPLPVIVVTGYDDEALVRRAQDGPVSAYLVKPIKQADLAPAIAVSMRRFEQLQEVRREATDLKQALDDRKLIERAKGVIMKRSQIDEDEAYRRMRKMSSDQNRKLVEVARMVLTAEEVFQPGPKSAETPRPRP